MTTNDDERVVPPDVIYNMFIRTTPQKVWDALTKSEFTTQYFFGRTVESDWKTGSPWKLLFPDGRVGPTRLRIPLLDERRKIGQMRPRVARADFGERIAEFVGRVGERR